eukprot:561598-Prorocentrum_minimum.AAC.2
MLFHAVNLLREIAGPAILENFPDVVRAKPLPLFPSTSRVMQALVRELVRKRTSVVGSEL